jgi:hypothetical protein
VADVIAELLTFGPTRIRPCPASVSVAGLHKPRVVVPNREGIILRTLIEEIGNVVWFCHDLSNFVYTIIFVCIKEEIALIELCVSRSV